MEVSVGPTGEEQVRWIKAGGGRSDAEVFRDVPDGPDMVVVPAGSFMIGSPNTEPQRESWKAVTEGPQFKVVIPRAFAADRYAITCDEFATFIAATAHVMDGGARVWSSGQRKHDLGNL